MKNKTKVVLGLAAMLAGTAGIAGVSTFAWFTTQSTADLGFTDAVVRGDNTYIAIKFASAQPSNNGFSTITGGANSGVTIDNTNDSKVAISGATVKMIDLSGDGLTFYHPTNYTEPTSASGEGSVVIPTCTGFDTRTANDSGIQYFLDFNITVYNKASNSTNVLLNTISVAAAPTPKEGGGTEVLASSTAAAKACRVAIFDITGTRTLTTMWNPAVAGDSYKYLKTATNATTYTHANSPCAEQAIASDAASSTDTVEKVFHAGAYTAGETTGNGRALGNLAAQNSERTYNIRMWIEGTLSTSTNSCIGGHVALSVQFRGSAA